MPLTKAKLDEIRGRYEAGMPNETDIPALLDAIVRLESDLVDERELHQADVNGLQLRIERLTGELAYAKGNR